MTSQKKAIISASIKVQNPVATAILKPLINWMKVEEKSQQTNHAYARAVEKIVLFHHIILVILVTTK